MKRFTLKTHGTFNMEKDENGKWIKYEDVTIEELEERLEEMKREEDIANIPQLIKNPSLKKLITLCASEMNHIFLKGRNTKDARNWFYEEVMETFYGTDVFDWINEQV